MFKASLLRGHTKRKSCVSVNHWLSAEGWMQWHSQGGGQQPIPLDTVLSLLLSSPHQPYQICLRIIRYFTFLKTDVMVTSFFFWEILVYC